VLEIGRDALTAAFALGNEQGPLGRSTRRPDASQALHSDVARPAPWRTHWPGPDGCAGRQALHRLPPGRGSWATCGEPEPAAPSPSDTTSTVYRRGAPGWSAPQCRLERSDSNRSPTPTTVGAHRSGHKPGSPSLRRTTRRSPRWWPRVEDVGRNHLSGVLVDHAENVFKSKATARKVLGRPPSHESRYPATRGWPRQ